MDLIWSFWYISGPFLLHFWAQKCCSNVAEKIPIGEYFDCGVVSGDHVLGTLCLSMSAEPVSLDAAKSCFISTGGTTISQKK